jgi:hypothetical protein
MAGVLPVIPIAQLLGEILKNILNLVVGDKHRTRFRQL